MHQWITASLYIYIYISLGSMAQWDNRKLVSQSSGLTPGSPCYSIVFIKNLINDKSKHKKKMFTICIILSGAQTVIYNIYKSMTSLWVHLYPLFVLYSIYIYIYMRFNKYILLLLLLYIIIYICIRDGVKYLFIFKYTNLVYLYLNEYSEMYLHISNIPPLICIHITYCIQWNYRLP